MSLERCMGSLGMWVSDKVAAARFDKHGCCKSSMDCFLMACQRAPDGQTLRFEVSKRLSCGRQDDITYEFQMPACKALLTRQSCWSALRGFQCSSQVSQQCGRSPIQAIAQAESSQRFRWGDKFYTSAIRPELTCSTRPDYGLAVAVTLRETQPRRNEQLLCQLGPQVLYSSLHLMRKKPQQQLRGRLPPLLATAKRISQTISRS